MFAGLLLLDMMIRSTERSTCLSAQVLGSSNESSLQSSSDEFLKGHEPRKLRDKICYDLLLEVILSQKMLFHEKKSFGFAPLAGDAGAFLLHCLWLGPSDSNLRLSCNLFCPWKLSHCSCALYILAIVG